MGSERLKIVSFKKWYRFVERYPKVEEQLENAIVKDMDDNHFLVDLSIVRNILKNNGYSGHFEL